MRILVTRPEPEAARFAAQLAEHGIDAVVAPLTTIELAAAALPPLEGVQALVFTSANGVRAYLAKHGRTDLPVFAVGDATAGAARLAGFGEIASAGSDWRGVADLVAARLDPAKGKLLQPVGEDQAGELPAALRARGFALEQAVVYRAAPVAALPAAARTALETGSVDGVALFSPRTAGLFAERAIAAGLAEALADVDAFCLSHAVADAVADNLAWRAVHVAAEPNGDSMLSLLKAIKAAREARKNSGDETAPPAWSEAERIIAAFGGIRPMAKTLGIAVTTVQGWKERGAIPLKRMGEIRDAAQRAGIDLDAHVAPDAFPQAERAETAARAEELAAEKISPAPDPGLRAAEAPPPPPPTFDATPADLAPPRWRWAMFGAGFGAAFVAGGIVAVLLGIGRGAPSATGPREALDRLQARIGTITSQLEDQQKRQQTDAAALQARLNRIDALEKALGEQRERMASIAGSAAALAARVEKLDMDVKGFGARTPAGNDEVKALKADVDALTKRIEALPKGGADAASLGAVTAELKQLGERLGAVERRAGEFAQSRSADAAAWKAALDRLAAELRGEAGKLAADAERLRKDVAALNDDVKRGSLGEGTGALLVSVGQLRRAVLEGAPYAAALEAVAALARDRAEMAPALATLRPRAAQGIPTLAGLRARFDRLAVAALRAGAAPAPDADVWDRIWSRVQGLVTIRRVGEVAGDTPAARISRAEAALARGDLAAAAKELAGLTGAAREAVAGWVGDAEARLAADAAVAALDRAALGALRAAPKAQP